jgi:hypothetical protein
MSRWEWIEGIRAETPSQVAVRELGKVLVSELKEWPPAVEWSDEGSRQRYAEIFAPDSVAPSSAVVAECFKVVRWELLRDFDAIGYYERNHELEKACPTRKEQLSWAFLRSYFSEAFFELIERTENRVTRRDLLAGMDELELRFKQSWQEQN